MATFQLVIENHTEEDRHVVVFGSDKKFKQITKSDPANVEITGIGASYKEMLSFFSKHIYEVKRVEVKATRVDNVPPRPVYYVHTEDLNKNTTSFPLNTKDGELIQFYSWKSEQAFCIDSLTSIDFNMPPKFKIEMFIDHEPIKQ